MEPITYKGMSRNGRGYVGSTSRETPAALAERLFRRGFRWLRVERGDVEVGGIKVDQENGRTWWGEA